MVKFTLRCDYCGSLLVGITANVTARGGVYPTVHVAKSECSISATCRCCARAVELPQSIINKFLKVAMKGTNIESKG